MVIVIHVLNTVVHFVGKKGEINMSNKVNNNVNEKDKQNEGYTTLQIGAKQYDALKVYAKSQGMTVDQAFAKAIRDYINENFTDAKDIKFGEKVPFTDPLAN